MLFVCFVMAPLSQKLEPPKIPGRFTRVDAERAQEAIDRTGPSITPQALKTFARQARKRMRTENGGYRRDHLRALAQRVEVDGKEVRIMGSKNELLRTLVAASSAKTAGFGVLSFVPKWRATELEKTRRHRSAQFIGIRASEVHDEDGHYSFPVVLGRTSRRAAKHSGSIRTIPCGVGECQAARSLAGVALHQPANACSVASIQCGASARSLWPSGPKRRTLLWPSADSHLKIAYRGSAGPSPIASNNCRASSVSRREPNGRPERTHCFR